MMLICRVEKTDFFKDLEFHGIATPGGRIGKVISRRDIIPLMESALAAPVPVKIGKKPFRDILAALLVHVVLAETPLPWVLPL